jgi:predicted pyridoxine 5'-phosphate oxidase superfamily flavin-nucleotide-binding protein
VSSPVDHEVRAFLQQSMVALVATRSANGHPFMTPLWFVAEGRTLVIATAAESWTSRNVSRHPDLALLFSGERSGRRDRVLRLRGTATVQRGLPPWRVLLRIVLKYYLAPAALVAELRHVRQWRLRARYHAQAKGGPVHLRVVPTTAEFLSRPDRAR